MEVILNAEEYNLYIDLLKKINKSRLKALNEEFDRLSYSDRLETYCQCSEGCNVGGELTYEGREVVDAIEEVERHNRYIDICIPDIDGWKVKLSVSSVD